MCHYTEHRWPLALIFIYGGDMFTVSVMSGHDDLTKLQSKLIFMGSDDQSIHRRNSSLVSLALALACQ